MTFRKILVANRGEIALRILRTCRAMGVPTVAVFAEGEGEALHVRMADEAYCLGPAEARGSYLSQDALLGAISRTGADAVHPGYGFLSENADFADAVAAAGATFIGPPGRVHRAMGDKKGARRLMAAAGVPVVRGYDDDDQQDATLLAAAEGIGWPVVIKPSRGGGGKGMRVVTRSEDFAEALAASRREALSSFGDGTMILEQFVSRPRHVEVQVLADSEGRMVHLLERECSVQRRHQKVVEESPSPALTGPSRASLHAAGLAAARAASYVNAGTVEFLLDEQGRFFFLEMNTRLQVEHPVTEAVVGVDLVRLQIEIASGKGLALSQEEVTPRGHAIECRLYAEDPYHGDLPSSGRILALEWPQGPGVRVDAGYDLHSAVTIHYDPLIAKIVAWGAERDEAISRMALALDDTVVLGVQTNLERLRAIVTHEAFRAGRLHTGFLAEHFPSAASPACPPEALAAALLALPPGEGASAAGAREDPWLRPSRLP